MLCFYGGGLFLLMRLQLEDTHSLFKRDMVDIKRFLRKTSFDETPELLNFFIGQMAFIGPRPGSAHNEEFLKECREKYTPNAYDIKPGISGYAQIEMKREHDPEFKAEWDHKYVLRMSFWFDIKIFVYTILKLFGAVKGR